MFFLDKITQILMLELTYAVLALVHCASRLESRRVQLRRGRAVLVRRRM